MKRSPNHYPRSWMPLALAFCALGAAHLDWLRLGHRHIEAGTVAHHHHSHAGAHDHHHHEGPGSPDSDDGSDGSESPGTYLASILLLSKELAPPAAIEEPALALRRSAVIRRPVRLPAATRSSAAPRGPPPA